MRIVCLQHVPFEGPAALASWAAARGHPMHTLRVFANEPLPALNTFDLLAILGGPMSVNGEADCEWLPAEKALVREAFRRQKQVFGICLGAQLIAQALGAAVVPATAREIGWFPVRRTPASGDHPAFAGLPAQFNAFHWHGETFELPEAATWLAESDACRHQAFSIGRHVLGLQFHLESTREGVDALIRHCPGDLAPGPWTQEPAAMLNAQAAFHESNRLLVRLLDRWTAPGNVPA